MIPTTEQREAGPLRIAVCLKQVPDPGDVRFNPKTKRVIREDVATTSNPLDLLALGHAIALRDAVGGEITVITMGPEGSRACLEDGVRRGADRGLHLLDRRFAGADTLATVRALSRALADDFDLVLLGRSTIDGATAQVAPQLAELLGVRQVTQATRLTPVAGGLMVEREGDDGHEYAQLTLPAVVSVHRGPAPPAPGPDRAVPIIERTADELGGGPRTFGTRGSPTFVKDVRAAAETIATVVMHDVGQAADALQRHLDDAASDPPAPSTDARPDAPARTIWAIAERRRDGTLHPISLEAIACARSAAAAYDARVVAVLLCDEPGDTPDVLAAHGCDAVLVVQDPGLVQFSTAGFTTALAAAIERDPPDAVIGPWTTDGRDYIPRVAARLSLGLTGDFVALEVDGPDEDADLLWIKPAWSGAVEAPIIAHTQPSMGTLRPGAVAALEACPGRDVPVDVFHPGLGAAPARLYFAPCGAALAAEERVDSFPVILSVGGDADAGLVDTARWVAREVGAALAGSAEAVAAGLLPPQCEVGLLRRSVAPRLFVALGRHSDEDLAAARRSGVVVTIGRGDPLPPHSRVDLAIHLEPDDVLGRLRSATREPV